MKEQLRRQRRLGAGAMMCTGHAKPRPSAHHASPPIYLERRGSQTLPAARCATVTRPAAGRPAPRPARRMCTADHCCAANAEPALGLHARLDCSSEQAGVNLLFNHASCVALGLIRDCWDAAGAACSCLRSAARSSENVLR